MAVLKKQYKKKKKKADTNLLSDNQKIRQIQIENQKCQTNTKHKWVSVILKEVYAVSRLAVQMFKTVLSIFLQPQRGNSNRPERTKNANETGDYKFSLRELARKDSGKQKLS
jgi:hypothetical protein